MFDIDYDTDCKFKSTRFFSMESYKLENGDYKKDTGEFGKR